MTDAQKRARDKYLSEKVEEIKFRVPKGKKAVIQARAAQTNESVNAYINRLVDEDINSETSTSES